MDHIFSIGQVGKILGVQPYKIAYAIEVGQLPEASFHFLHKRCFLEKDIKRMAEHFGVEAQIDQIAQKGAQ
jgi:hypothetical protein